ncbi:MAG: ThiF family adenylyltransferase [Hyphomicrobiaceae bacterium]|nr:ThiF family adenylyltransferase [Hyphomicrobiaceae bacterium]
MNREIVIPRPVLEEAVSRLLEHSRPVSLSAAMAYLAGREQILLARRSIIGDDRPRFELRLPDSPRPLLSASPDLLGMMTIDPDMGRANTILFMDSGQEPVNSLLLVGENMQRCSLAPDQTTERRDLQRWSRFIGALDMGTLDAFRNLHFAIAGVGRNGSLMATSLMHAGVRHLTLIDPDHMEQHNLDAMDGVSDGDIGRPKAVALAQGLMRPGGSTPEAVTCSVTSPKGLAALRRADILISCVDDDGARLAIAMAATLYLKPLLDIGSGISRTNGTREMGGDIRLVLPGERRCLACFGGFARSEDIDALIENKPVTRPWNAGRAGSLRSLNEINVHYGLRLLEDLFAGELSHSTWLRLTWQGSIPSVEALEPPAQHNCPLCRQEGVGDDALSHLPQIAGEMRDDLRTQKFPK